MKTLIVVLVVAAAGLITAGITLGPKLAGGGGLGISFGSAPEGDPVSMEAAQVGDLIETVRAPGKVEPHTIVKMAAEVSARILELPVQEGDLVRKGDLVCKLDDRDLKATLALASARRDGERYRLQSDQRRLEGLHTNLEFAQRDLERKRALHASGDIPDRDLDAALERTRDLETSIESTVFSISVAESSLAAAEAEIDRAQTGLDNTVIRAPMDGTVVTVNVEVGEVVTGSTTNPGTVIMTIADFSRMIMDAEIAESDVAKVEVGQRAHVRINAYPDVIFDGTVRQVAMEGRTDQTGSGFFLTEVEIDLAGRDDGIDKSGLMANVDIEIATHHGVVVPYQAIVAREIDDLPDDARRSELVDATRRRAEVVYRVVNGRTVCTPVRGGPSDLTHRLVREGLAEGETIVTGPFKVLESLKHDQRVRDRDAAKPAPDDGDAAAVAATDA